MTSLAWKGRSKRDEGENGTREHGRSSGRGGKMVTDGPLDRTWAEHRWEDGLWGREQR